MSVIKVSSFKGTHIVVPSETVDSNVIFDLPCVPPAAEPSEISDEFPL